MTPEFFAAVIDTLLPGDDVLPSGTGAGLDPAAYVPSHRTVFDAIAAQAGGKDPFARAGENARCTTLQAIERAAPDAFRALLVSVLSDYYEAPAVLAALGWRPDPPQPLGHSIAGMDNHSLQLLDRAKRRDRLRRP